MPEISKRLSLAYDPASMELAKRGDIMWLQDGMVPFLLLKITHFSKSWYFYTTVGKRGVRRLISRVELMSVSEARLRAYDWKRLVESGEVPPSVSDRLRAFQRKAMPLKEMFNEYYGKHLILQARSHKWIKRSFDLYFQPIKDHSFARLSPQVLRDWLNGIAKNVSPATANRPRTNLRACLRWGAAQRALRLQTRRHSLAGRRNATRRKSLNAE